MLAAENDPINQIVLRTILRQVGDGLQAVGAWKAADWDLILMNAQMPGMDGGGEGDRAHPRYGGRGWMGPHPNRGAHRKCHGAPGAPVTEAQAWTRS